MRPAAIALNYMQRQEYTERRTTVIIIIGASLSESVEKTENCLYIYVYARWDLVVEGRILSVGTLPYASSYGAHHAERRTD